MGLLKGPDLQTVDAEILLEGQWLVVKGGASGGGASVQISIQPESQVTSAGGNKRTGAQMKKLLKT